MRKLFLATMTLCLGVISLSASQVTVAQKDTTPDLCERYTKKVEVYKLNMLLDRYAEAALASYKKKAKAHCSETEK